MVTLTVDTSALTDGQQADSADAKTPINDLKLHMENTLNGVQAFDQQNFGTPQSATISGGVITMSKTHMVLSAEASASADDLDTIQGGSTGRYLVIRPASGVAITLKHGTGNLRTPTGVDIVLSGDGWALGIYKGAAWLLMNPLSNVFLQERGSTQSLVTATIKVPDRSVIDEGSGVQRLLYTPSYEAGNWLGVRAAAATVQPIGVAAPTIANSPVNANDADGPFITLPTTGVSGNAGGLISASFDLLWRDHNPVFVAVVKTPSTNFDLLRYWIGLIAAAPSDNDNVGQQFAGFRYSTVTADAGWIPVTRSSTTQTTGTAIGTIAGNTRYKLMLRVDSANAKIYFSVNDSAEQEITTNLPATGTNLGFVVRVFTQTAGIRQINFSRAYIEMK